jgi:hypothetical protein
MDNQEIRILSKSLADDILYVFRREGGYSGLTAWLDRYEGPYRTIAQRFINSIGKDNENPARRHFDLNRRDVEEIICAFIVDETNKSLRSNS